MSKKIIIVVILLIIVVISCLAYQYFGEQFKSDTINIDDWQVYSNKEFEYQINYPLDWVIEEKFKQDYLCLVSPERQLAINEGEMVYMCDLRIVVYSSPDEILGNRMKELSFSQWIHNNPDPYGFIKEKEIKVDDVLAYQGHKRGVENEYFIFTEYDNKLYEIEVHTLNINLTPKTSFQIPQKIIDSFYFLK